MCGIGSFSASASFGVLACKHVEQIRHAESAAGLVEIDKVALRATTLNSAQLHARDVARIGDVDVYK